MSRAQETESRNPYRESGKPPILKRSVLAYMDILGYRDMAQRASVGGTEQQLLEGIHKALSEGRVWLEDKEEFMAKTKALSEKDDFALKAFTDNIVIGWPVFDDAEDELAAAFFKVGYFQFQMVTSGLFLRGAISLGEAYVDDVAVAGRALNEAYVGESTLARDPRIILTSSAVEAVTKHLEYYARQAHAPQARDVLRDSDGQYFLNYMDFVFLPLDEGNPPLLDDVLRHKSAVETQLIANKGRPDIWSKYAWVAGYHNYFCDLHSEYFDNRHKISIELFRASPSLIV
jgi:hypothetical protein